MPLMSNASLSGLGFIHPRSRTMVVPGAAETVRSAQARTQRTRVQMSVRGVGNAFASVPTWTWWAGGGLFAGLIGGALLFKKKK